jgi:hypothetical protein
MGCVLDGQGLTGHPVVVVTVLRKLPERTISNNIPEILQSRWNDLDMVIRPFGLGEY